MKAGAAITIDTYDPEAWRKDVDFVASLEGVEQIEVGLDFIPVRDGHIDELAEIMGGSLLEKHVRVSRIGMSFSAAWPDLEGLSFRQALKAVAVAERIGASHITFLAGTVKSELTDENSTKAVAAYMNMIRDGSEVPVAIEGGCIGFTGTNRKLGNFRELAMLGSLVPGLGFSLNGVAGNEITSNARIHDFISDNSGRIVSIRMPEINLSRRSAILARAFLAAIDGAELEHTMLTYAEQDHDLLAETWKRMQTPSY